MIVRTVVAMGGNEVVFVGHEKPWSFKKSTESFSRKLERTCEIVFQKTEEDYFAWAEARGYTSIAVEISEDAVPVEAFNFPESPALIFGNEGTGLSRKFLDSCEAIVRIRQFGPVGSLNVATAAAIAMHELNRREKYDREVEGGKYLGEKNVWSN